jgi:hypothetical protein
MRYLDGFMAGSLAFARDDRSGNEKSRIDSRFGFLKNYPADAV